VRDRQTIGAFRTLRRDRQAAERARLGSSLRISLNVDRSDGHSSLLRLRIVGLSPAEQATASRRRGRTRDGERILVPRDQSLVAESVLPIIADVAPGRAAAVSLLDVSPVPSGREDEHGRVLALRRPGDDEGREHDLTPASRLPNPPDAVPGSRLRPRQKRSGLHHQTHLVRVSPCCRTKPSSFSIAPSPARCPSPAAQSAIVGGHNLRSPRAHDDDVRFALHGRA